MWARRRSGISNSQKNGQSCISYYHKDVKNPFIGLEHGILQAGLWYFLRCEVKTVAWKKRDGGCEILGDHIIANSRTDDPGTELSFVPNTWKTSELSSFWREWEDLFKHRLWLPIQEFKRHWKNQSLCRIQICLFADLQKRRVNFLRVAILQKRWDTPSNIVVQVIQVSALAGVIS
jgi:hypothetical protein